MALGVALYSQGQKEQGIQLGKTALKLDHKYRDLEYLHENLWGKKLLKDTQKFLSEPEVDSFINQFK